MAAVQVTRETHTLEVRDTEGREERSRWQVHNSAQLGGSGALTFWLVYKLSILVVQLLVDRVQNRLYMCSSLKSISDTSSIFLSLCF